jgi:hypothetical protein
MYVHVYACMLYVCVCCTHICMYVYKILPTTRVCGMQIKRFKPIICVYVCRYVCAVCCSMWYAGKEV